MAELQAAHRRRLENRDSWSEALQRIGGLASASFMGLGGIGGGVFLIHTGHDVSGLATLLVALGTLIASFRGVKKLREQKQSEQYELPLGRHG